MEGGNFPTRLPSRSGADVTNSAANPSHESAASTNARTAANPSHESAAITNARTAASSSHESAASSNARPPLMEHEQFRPIANIIRIMRRMTPPYGKIPDEAKETMQECVSEFIGFITSEANEKCHREQRKTVTAEDLLWAMSQLGFDDYVGPLTLYLNRYREVEGRISVRGEPLVRRRVEFEPPPPPSQPMPPMQPPMYGGVFDMGLPPMSGMFDAMGGRPMDGDEMGGPMYGPVMGDGAGGYYFGDESGASSSSSYPPLPEFDPYAKFK